MDLAPFQNITPCGIADKAVTSVQRLLADKDAPGSGLGNDELLLEYRYGLLDAFAGVFDVQLQQEEVEQLTA
jgi:lipoate-protein ligase B